MDDKKLKEVNEVTLTKNAIKKIKEIALSENKKDFGLKLYVLEGGCSGFQYGMDFEEKPAKTDLVIKEKDVKLFIDKESLEMLKGTKIDYIENDQASGFKIDNPNVKSGCGCGKNSC